jgi:ATP-binding protein involved in chromosome partitioning
MLEPKTKIEDVKKIVMVASGKGGVGKSTVAVNLAIALARQGYKIGLMDADIFGPSIPMMFGVASQKPEIVDLGSGEQYLPIIKYGIQLISIGNFIEPDQAIIWRGPMASKTLMEIISRVVWKDLDILLIDLPPGTSDIHLTVTQELEVDGAILVTTPQNVACADALKAGKMLTDVNINIKILGIVENMAYFQTEKLAGEKFYIFGKGGGELLSKALNTELIGQIPIVEEVCESGDNGNPEKNFEIESIANAYMAIAKNVAGKLGL